MDNDGLERRVEAIFDGLNMLRRGEVYERALAATDALREEVQALRAALVDARTELARWGWGDFHYGSTGQDKRVVDALAAIDRALGESNG